MHQNLNRLTNREKDILRLLARGHDAKSAASVLNVSVNSINERLREARRKLEKTSSREAARTLFEAEGGNPQEVWDEKIGVDGTLTNVADDTHPAQRGVKQASLLTALGVGIMLVVALILALSSGSADNPGSRSEPLSPLPAASGSSEPSPSTIALRPTYSVALEGTFQRHPIEKQRMTLPAGGMGSMSSAGAYDIHFIVTPDAEHDGKVLISVNVVIPRVGAQSRYSRMLAVAEGQVANFNFEPMGPDHLPGTLAITAHRVEPRS